MKMLIKLTELSRGCSSAGRALPWEKCLAMTDTLPKEAAEVQVLPSPPQATLRVLLGEDLFRAKV